MTITNPKERGRSDAWLRGALAGACFTLAALGAGRGIAATATYQWVPTFSTGGSGTLVFDIGAQDPGNFTGLGVGSVLSLTFTFATLGETVDLSDVVSRTVTSPPGFAAGRNAANAIVPGWYGYLTSNFLFSTNQANPLFQLTFQGVEYPNTSSTAVLWTGAGLEQNFGYWQLDPGGPGPSLIPEASSGALVAAGLLGVGVLLRIRRRSAPRRGADTHSGYAADQKAARAVADTMFAS